MKPRARHSLSIKNYAAGVVAQGPSMRTRTPVPCLEDFTLSICDPCTHEKSPNSKDKDPGQLIFPNLFKPLQSLSACTPTNALKRLNLGGCKRRSHRRRSIICRQRVASGMKFETHSLRALCCAYQDQVAQFGTLRRGLMDAADGSKLAPILFYRLPTPVNAQGKFYAINSWAA